ncbi:type 2 isopentenyl-diphosphate Delta-isomerase [bacterium]|nr:type 2 isopentenyl-diphosphate Delta-isomerase [bacterium]
MSISKRKKDHLNIALNRDVEFRNKTTGFENYDFLHCAAPELNIKDADTSVQFLNKKLSMPFMVSGMTGGCKEAVSINRSIAQACAEESVAMGVGSERQLFENSDFIESYTIVRKYAPKIPVIGNIGGVQLAEADNFDKISRLIDVIEADAMAVHLNPLQELLQPGGDVNFSDILKAVETLSKSAGVPVIIKEIGCGISEEIAGKFIDAGAEYIDVAGAGGTSWAAIESYRTKNSIFADSFRDWGISTAVSIEMVKRIKGAGIIASGGIRSGIDMAKALALGAQMCGAALPALKAVSSGGNEKLIGMIGLWRMQLKTVLFLTGSKKIEHLQREGVCYKIRN